jgi:hypothetical protein
MRDRHRQRCPGGCCGPVSVCGPCADSRRVVCKPMTCRRNRPSTCTFGFRQDSTPPQGLRRLCGGPSQDDEPPRTERSGAVLLSSGISRPDVAGSRSPRDARASHAGPVAKSHPAVGGLGVRGSYQEPPKPPPPPPRTSPGEDPRRVPERGAGALPAPPADLVVRTRGPLAVRVALDVGVQPDPAPQWLPSHEPTLGVAERAGKGRMAPSARSAPPPGARVPMSRSTGARGRRRL